MTDIIITMPLLLFLYLIGFYITEKVFTYLLITKTGSLSNKELFNEIIHMYTATLLWPITIVVYIFMFFALKFCRQRLAKCCCLNICGKN